MSWGSIIVSTLYQKFKEDCVGKIQYPNLPLDNEEELSLVEISKIGDQTLRMWSYIEEYFHVYDNMIHYDKDDDASMQFRILLQEYYVQPFNVLNSFMNQKLMDCRKEASLCRWTSALVHIYSDYYLMRQNLIQHIRYLQRINHLMIGCKSVPVGNLDELKLIPIHYTVKEGNFYDKIVFFLWRCKCALFQNAE